MRRWRDAVAGWKVGTIAPDLRVQMGAERLAGPIFRQSVVSIAPGEQRTMPIFAGGFAAVEAEFVIRLATRIEPAARTYTDAELIERIAAVHIGAEIASSPLADINRLGPCCVVSDFGNNAGLVLGPEVPDWAACAPETMTVTVTVDGEQVGAADAGSIEGGFLRVLRFIVELSAHRDIALDEGALISTGAVSGIHEVTEASVSTIDFGTCGSFDVHFEPMQSRS